MNWKEFLAGVATATSVNESPTTLSDSQLLLFDVMDTVSDTPTLLWLEVMKLRMFGNCDISVHEIDSGWRCHTEKSGTQAALAVAASLRAISPE